MCVGFVLLVVAVIGCCGFGFCVLVVIDGYVVVCRFGLGFCGFGFGVVCYDVKFGLSFGVAAGRFVAWVGRWV